jgi:hypothetical protein
VRRRIPHGEMFRLGEDELHRLGLPRLSVHVVVVVVGW